MPLPFLWADQRMMARLTAEEALQAAQNAALGTGALTKATHNQVRSALLEAAYGGRRAERPTSRAGLQALAAAHGIGFAKVPRD